MTEPHASLPEEHAALFIAMVADYLDYGGTSDANSFPIEEIKNIVRPSGVGAAKTGGSQ